LTTNRRENGEKEIEIKSEMLGGAEKLLK